MTNKTILAFHIGRGGRFNNQGHVSFRGVETLNEVIGKISNWTFEHTRDSEGKFCTPYLADHNGNHLIDLKELATGTGTLNFDNDYDTYYCLRLEDCGDKEIAAIERSNEYGKEEILELLSEIA